MIGLNFKAKAEHYVHFPRQEEDFLPCELRDNTLQLYDALCMIATH